MRRRRRRRAAAHQERWPACSPPPRIARRIVLIRRKLAEAAWRKPHPFRNLSHVAAREAGGGRSTTAVPVAEAEHWRDEAATTVVPNAQADHTCCRDSAQMSVGQETPQMKQLLSSLEGHAREHVAQMHTGTTARPGWTVFLASPRGGEVAQRCVGRGPERQR